MALLSPVFRTAENLLENIARPASIVALIAIGQTFVITSRGLDLSVGSTAALSATVGILLITDFGLSVPAGILLTIVAGALLGLANGLIIAKVGVAPFIVTLGTLSIGRGLTLVLSGHSFTYGLPDAYRELGRGSVSGIPIPLLLLAVTWIAGFYLFSHTRLGIYCRAIGGNETVARLAGINVDRYKMVFYTMVGAVASLAGILWSARANSISVTTGTGAELDSIAAVIIGGTSLFGGSGTIAGSVVGTFTLTLLGNGLQLLGVTTLAQRIVVGTVIIVALALRAWREQRVQRRATVEVEG